MEFYSGSLNKNNFLAKVDARTKMVVTLTLLLMVLSYDGVLYPHIIGACAFSVCLIMRIPLRILALRMAQPMFIAAAVVLLKMFFSGSEVLFSFNIFGWEMAGHRDGLMEGLRIMSRITGGVSLILVFGFATPFIEIMGALSWLRIPRQFTEIMMFANHYLFVFLEDAITIYSAQKNRLGYAGIRKGLSSFGILTGALVLKGFEQSQKTADAMIQRGYTGDMPLPARGPVKAVDMAVAAAIVIMGGIVWMI